MRCSRLDLAKQGCWWSTVRMLELEKWGQDKMPLLVMFAHQVAMSAEACYEACRMARTNDIADGLVKLPSLRDWYSLYRNHRRMKTVLRGIIANEMPHGEMPAEMLEMKDEVQAFLK